MNEQVETPVEEAAVETPAAEAVIEQPAETVERDTESDTLEIPDSSAEGGKARYVPLSALDGARRELKDLKAELHQAKEGSAKAQTLETRIDELSAQLAQIAPKAQAYDAIHAANQQPRQVDEAPEDRAELEEIAKDFEFYKPDGSLDLVKSQRHQARTRKEAEKIARAQVEPLAQHAVTQQSDIMLRRAMATVAPNGAKPSTEALKQVWSRLDPRLTATVEGATQAWNAALGFTHATQQAAPAASQAASQRAANGTFAKAEIGEPLYTEKAGGKDTQGQPKLSDKELKYLKDAGITEKEYIESAQTAPWLRR